MIHGKADKQGSYDSRCSCGANSLLPSSSRRILA